MKVVVGLGNPGEKYQGNRHNAGFMVVDRMAEIRNQKSEIRWESKFGALICRMGDVLLVKPQTFMNQSGKAVSEVVNFYKISMNDLYVAHDDLDIRLGEYKIVNGVGPKIHNGLNSIEASIGRNDFWRVRVGIDNRRMANGEWRMAGEEYVLSDFVSDEKTELNKVIEMIVGELMLKLR